MPVFKVRLLGTFQLSNESGDEKRLSAGKARELLCYLLLNRDRMLPREALASVFWGEETTNLSKKHLRQTLWTLHSNLDTPHAREGGFLRVLPDSVYLDSTVGLWLDVAVIERAAMRCQGIPGHRLSPALADELRSAAALYRGDLLAGCYQDWCVAERERIQGTYLGILEKLMAYAEAQGAYDQGLHYGTLALAIDRASESVHRRMMRLYFLSGDRTSALRQYTRCEAALREELAVHPTHATDTLLQHIRQDRLPDTPPSPDVAAPLRSMQDVVTHLEQACSSLVDMLAQVRGELEAIESTLNGPGANPDVSRPHPLPESVHQFPDARARTVPIRTRTHS